MNHDRPPWPRAPFFGALALAGALGGALLAGACGGDDEAPAGPGPIPIEALRAEYTVASCELQVRCGLMPDKETCLRLDDADPGLAQRVASVVFGRLRYDPAAARACVEATRSHGCTTLLSEQRALEAACDGIFSGGLAEGDPCLVDDECSGKSSCDRSLCDAQCCLGACAPEPAPAPVGGDCSRGPCVDEAYCESEGGEGGGGGSAPTAASCQPRNENGQACEASDACKDGQRCAEGKCYILSREGEACNPNLDVACLSFNNWCDPAAMKCGKLPGPGEACAKNERCQGFAYCDAGTCRARPVENEPCPVDGPACLGDLRCEMDVCVAPPDQTVCVLNDHE